MIIISTKAFICPAELQAKADGFREQAKTGLILLPLGFELEAITEDEEVKVIGPDKDDKKALKMAQEMVDNYNKKYGGWDDGAEAGLTSED